MLSPALKLRGGSVVSSLSAYVAQLIPRHHERGQYAESHWPHNNKGSSNGFDMSFDLSITTERPKDISNTFKDLFPVHEVVFQQDIEWRVAGFTGREHDTIRDDMHPEPEKRERKRSVAGLAGGNIVPWNT
ncbi:hypothetical protein L917_18933 [Phytophthora nicotianae]|uniref:Uncharacterized protein n=1 Tax=Phytophthora nicotianae TaxID=4792 RepID=W2K857_PHYNI|nr:hypothetical protein L917_18933 [Phytophthora nicotianae]